VSDGYQLFLKQLTNKSLIRLIFILGQMMTEYVSET